MKLIKEIGEIELRLLNVIRTSAKKMDALMLLILKIIWSEILKVKKITSLFLRALLFTAAIVILLGYIVNQFVPGVKTKGQVRPYDAAIVALEKSTLPQNIQAMLDKENWIIIVTDENLKQEYYQEFSWGGIGGLTFPNERKIMINSGQGSYLLFHEIGHAVDSYCGRISHEEDFQEIYIAEAKALATYNYGGGVHGEYAASSPDEFFADVFSLIFIGNEDIDEICPKAATFIRELVAKI